MAAENTIDPNIMKRTQESLGKYIKKPQFTDKLLKKPPFRFLHDVINVVIKETGTLNGLYTKSELISDNIKDRESKIAFLQKLIDVIKITTNENVTVRPSKIVAGHEPEKTNEMLQLLGRIIEQKLDCSKAIEQVTGEIPTITKATSKVKVKETAEKPVKSKIPAPLKRENSKESRDKAVKVKEIDKKVKKIVKVESTESDSIKDGNKKKNPSVSKAKIVDSNKSNNSDKKLRNNKEIKENTIAKKDSNKSNETLKKEHKVENDESVKTPINQTKRKESDSSILENDKIKTAETSDKINQKIEEAIQNQIETTSEIPSSRKSSAPSRKSSIDKSDLSNQDNVSESGVKILKENNIKNVEKINSPPKKETITNNEEKPVKLPVNNENNVKHLELKRQSTFTREDSKENSSTIRPRTSLRPPSVRPASSRPGAPRRRDKNVEIILQPNDQIKLAGIQVKLESFNAELEDDGENLVIIENSNSGDLIKPDDDKITANTDEEENQQGHLVQQILETQKELVQNIEDIKYESDIDTIQKRESSAKQMDSLRDLIQSLTRSINPLGKLMDFIPEDIDSMQLEMTMWRDNYSQAAAELKKEKSLTESAIEPMKNQLSQINANIIEYTEMIDASQAKILQNSEKIHYLLIDQ